TTNKTISAPPGLRPAWPQLPTHTQTTMPEDAFSILATKICSKKLRNGRSHVAKPQSGTRSTGRSPLTTAPPQPSPNGNRPWIRSSPPKTYLLSYLTRIKRVSLTPSQLSLLDSQ